MEVKELVLAGWTGRDEAALKKHIHELEELGVKAPKTTPIFYRVSSSLLCSLDEIQVSGPDTSGEVEFVMLQKPDGLWITVGSDHTDRKAETIGVSLSKQLCQKVIAKEAWRYEEIEPHWDKLILRAWIPEKGKKVLYQEAAVASMRSPEDLIARYGKLPTGWVMFSGTPPAIGGIRGAERFEMQLEDPVLKRSLRHAYGVKVLPVEG